MSEYTAKQIQVLEGIKPVRKRPGMYIGGTGIEGLHRLIWELVDNSIDEAMAGHANKIELVLKENQLVEVFDNGRGIPIDTHPQTKKSALETVMTTLHAGGKFGSGSYKVSGGLHGVGVSVVNALSDYMKTEVYRDGRVWVQEYKRGQPQGPVKDVGQTNLVGTRQTFHPDPKIFPEINFSRKTILDHLRQQAYLTKSVKFSLKDISQRENDFEYTFYFEGGIASFARHLARHKKPINTEIFYFEKESDNVLVEVALTYVNDYSEHVYTFANNINTPEGGTHLTGFRSALTRALGDYAKKNNLIKSPSDFSGEDTREGLVAILSVKLPEPQFEGQTKDKLGNPEIRGIVDTLCTEYLNYWLDQHPQEARQILNKVLISARARQAAKAARETVIRKSAFEGAQLPGKLADCSQKKPELSELFIVEGDSAGGSAKQGRDRMFQAILPLRGKILNVERARLDKVLLSDEIKALIIAIGAGIAQELDTKKTRYHKIIIMTDADVDGAHIRTLLLTLFYRHFRHIIDLGYLYIAQPPLYGLSQGKSKYYAFSDEQKDSLLSKLAQVSDPAKTDPTTQRSVNLQRYKGLGEMNPEQLWETTMDPNQRTLLKVMIEDAVRADELFTMLMGDDVLPRKQFIQTHAQAVKNLDI